MNIEQDWPTNGALRHSACARCVLGRKTANTDELRPVGDICVIDVGDLYTAWYSIKPTHAKRGLCVLRHNTLKSKYYIIIPVRGLALG